MVFSPAKTLWGGLIVGVVGVHWAVHGDLLEKVAGNHEKVGVFSSDAPPFSGSTTCRLRDGWATWRRFRSWPFAPQAPGEAAAERIVALCLLRGGSDGADGNCCAASAKVTKGAVGLRRRNKKTARTVR